MSDETLLTADTTTAKAEGADENSTAVAGDAQAQEETTPEGAQDSAAGAEKADSGEKAEAKDAPAEYGDFNIPEGIEVPEEYLGQFKEVAQSNKLTQDAAQQLLDLHLAIVQKGMEDHKATVAKWAEEVKADPKLGGQNLDTTLAQARSAMQRFGGDNLRAVLEQSGLGNHPEFVRFFAEVGKTIREADFITQHGEGTDSSPEAAFRRMYPTMFKTDNE